MLGPTILRVIGQQFCVGLHGPKSLTGFKLYATSANIAVVPCKRMQHVGPTMLRPFVWTLSYVNGTFTKHVYTKLANTKPNHFKLV